MMKLQENSKQLSFLIICLFQKPTFEVLSTNLKTLTANKLYFLVQLIIRGVRLNPTNPPWIRPWSKAFLEKAVVELVYKFDEKSFEKVSRSAK